MALSYIQTVFNSFFYSGVYPVHGSRATRRTGLQNKKHSLCEYVWKITGNPRLERLKIVAVMEVTFKESAQQGSSSSKEAARVELTSHQRNKKGN